jgi:hypothetical protein
MSPEGKPDSWIKKIFRPAQGPAAEPERPAVPLKTLPIGGVISHEIQRDPIPFVMVGLTAMDKFLMDSWAREIDKVFEASTQSTSSARRMKYVVIRQRGSDENAQPVDALVVFPHRRDIQHNSFYASLAQKGYRGIAVSAGDVIEIETAKTYLITGQSDSLASSGDLLVSSSAEYQRTTLRGKFGPKGFIIGDH